MAVELTDEQYGHAFHTLAQIATGKDCDGKRLSREEIVTMARELCDNLKLPYGSRYHQTCHNAADH